MPKIDEKPCKTRRPPRLRKPDITRDLNGIDEEIRHLMVAINKLPFVKYTVMSCAGYGKNAFPEHPHGTRKDGLWHGWFSVVYKDGTKHHSFDKGLRNIADCLENHDRGVVVYDFASENVHGLMAKWLCIGELVKTHLKGE